ncbi:MAG: alpha-L-rhamnosidase-related protein, partial [Bacilli bacterium]
LHDEARDDVQSGALGYGDWLSIDADTPLPVLATAYFAHSVHLTMRTARVLGNTEDARELEDLFQRIRAAFQRAFVAENGVILGDAQTAYVLALYMDLLEPGQRSKALQRLVADIERRGNRLSTGFLGVRYLLPVLTQNGRLDVAYRLLCQTQFPSWLYPVLQGATTIWERWDGWTEHKGFQDPGMNSFNHYSLGSVGEWLFDTVAGIASDPEQPGFRRVHIRPRPGNGIEWVNAEYRSIRGTIKCSWESRGDSFRLRVEIPANTTALIHVPAGGVGGSGNDVSDDHVGRGTNGGHGGVEDRAFAVEVVQGAEWIRRVGERPGPGEDLFAAPSGVYEFVRRG